MSSEKLLQYQNQKIMTASPAMLVFMLYERAIGCLKEAIKSIEADEIEIRWKANKKAMEIIVHMQMTLDLKAGGEIAENLDGIYSYLLRALPKVDLKNDPAPAREAIKLLEPLCESWRQIADQGDAATQLAARTAATQAAANPASKAAGSGSAAHPGDGGQTPNSDKSSDQQSPNRITISA